MDTNLELYGWSGSGDCSLDPAAKKITFIEKSLITNAHTYYNTNNFLKVSASFLFKSVDNGLVLWYNNTIGNIIFSCNDTKLEIKKTHLNRETVVKNTRFDILGITPPAENETINLKAEINKNHVIFYYNDQSVFEIEDNSFNGGYFGLFGDANTVCTSFAIDAKEPTGWQYYTEAGTIIKRIGEIPNFELEVIIADDTSPKNAYIYQDVNIQDAGTYTLSFDYVGNIYAEIYQDDTLVDSAELNSTDYTKGINVFDITTPGLISIRIGSKVKGSSKIAKPQLEYKSFNTSYVSDIRGSSKVTFPSKKLNIELGALGLWIIPSHNYSTGNLPIFYYNNEFRLDYTSQNFVLSYGTKTLSINKPIEEGKAYYISCSWETQSLIILNIYDRESQENFTNSISLGIEDIEKSDFIYVGSNPSETGNVTVDNLVIMNGPITLDEVRYHRYQENLYDERTIVKCGFNMETFNYDKNRISVPIARADSPIIIQTSEGKEYNRVCFLDEEGNYTLYHKENFIFNGTRTFNLRFNNIIKAIAYSSTIRDDFITTINDNQVTLNNIDIKVERELLSTNNGIVYSARFKNWMKDKNVIIEMEDEENNIVVVPEEEYVINYEDGSIELPGMAILNIYASYNYTNYIGKEITIMYIIEDTYCLNYSNVFNQYEVQLSNVDGKDIYLTYQNTDGVMTKRLKTIELNPFKSVNNSGFIYIEDTPRELKTFDVKITPDSLVANGHDTATITIDCLSEGGTPTSNVELELKKTIASNELFRYISPEEQEWLDYRDEYGEEATIKRYGNLTTDEHRSGRFIYKYKAGTQITENEKIDNITITDKVSKIEIQIPIRLVRE